MLNSSLLTKELQSGFNVFEFTHGHFEIKSFMQHRVPLVVLLISVAQFSINAVCASTSCCRCHGPSSDAAECPFKPIV